MKSYSLDYIVKADDIDAFGHVNNVSYLRWFNNIAAEHCEFVGYGGKKMWEDGFGWIIKSHKIEYLIALKPYQRIKIITEIEWIKAASSLRKYKVLNEAGDICALGETLWVWVNYKTGKPCRTPEEIIRKFNS